MANISESLGPYAIRLTYYNDTTQDIIYSVPIHLVHDIHYGVVKQIIVGSQLRVYGLINQKIDNKVETKYIHLEDGLYNLKIPFLFQTFHVISI